MWPYAMRNGMDRSEKEHSIIAHAIRNFKGTECLIRQRRRGMHAGKTGLRAPGFANVFTRLSRPAARLIDETSRMRDEPLPKNSVLTAFQRSELRDSALGLMWPEQYGATVLAAERRKTKDFQHLVLPLVDRPATSP